MTLVTDLCRDQGYTFREKANVYVGAALGFTTPLVVGGALLHALVPETKGFHPAGFYGASAVFLGAVSCLSGGFPLRDASRWGALLGCVGANSLKKKRSEREYLEDFLDISD